MFKVGQKVVCINDDWFEHPSWADVAHKPVKGQIYTVRDIDQLPLALGFDIPGLHLIELTNPTQFWYFGMDIFVAEISFESDRFRPLEEKKTDISAFTSLLKTKELEVV